MTMTRYLIAILFSALSFDALAAAQTVTTTANQTITGVKTFSGSNKLCLKDPVDADLACIVSQAISGAVTITLPSTTSTLATAGAVTGSGLTMATARLLGRTTASTGAIEEISVGAGLSLSAGSLTASGGGVGGSDTQVQYNNASAFGGSANFTFAANGGSGSKVLITSNLPSSAQPAYAGLSVQSGNAAQYSGIATGTNVNKSWFGTSGGTNDYVTGTAAGDTAIVATSGNKIVIGIAGVGGASAATLSSTGFTVSNTATGYVVLTSLPSFTTYGALFLGNAPASADFVLAATIKGTDANVYLNTPSGGDLVISEAQSTNNVLIRRTNGNVGIGRGVFSSSGTVPTAKVHIGAGSATASTAPLKLTSGTNLTTAEAGAFEYNGTNLFFTRTGTTRENIVTASAVTSVSPTAPDRTITVNVNGTTYYVHAKTTND